jgi:arylsulfatase A-like enzyme
MAADRPNIIFLLTDDQRADALGAAGNATMSTPHLDKLASEGVYFENAFVTTSICAVSRASILTGQYARRHGIWGFSKNFTDAQLANTYPLVLRSAGYVTGFVGKYGVGTDMPAAHFDYWRGFAGQGTFRQQGSDGQPLHLTQKIGSQISAFIDSVKNLNAPFCLSVSFKAPHVEGDPGHFLPDTAYSNLYKGMYMPVPVAAAPEYFNHFPDTFTENNVARNRWRSRFATAEMQQENIRKYYRLVSGVDVVVGQIREKLSATGLAQNTIIIFTSDNGFYLGEYGFAGKWYGSEPSIRVPLIIYDPRPQALHSKTVSHTALNIDIAPTILSLAGAPAPADMQGRDLSVLGQQPSADWRDGFFYEHLWQSSPRYYIPSTEGLRWKDKKYMRYFIDADSSAVIFEELYDLSQDPHEINNLALEPGHHELLQSMRDKYRELKAQAR